MAQEENTVVADEATPETDTTQTSEETSDNASDISADETTAEDAAEDTVESDVTAESQPELNESLTETTGASQETERVEVENGRDYELLFIVRITESTDSATERVRAIIEQSGGVVDNVRVSEQRRLAYPIKKEIEGFYVVLNGRFTKEAAAELDRALKLDEAVLRHMTIRLDEE